VLAAFSLFPEYFRGGIYRVFLFALSALVTLQSLAFFTLCLLPFVSYLRKVKRVCSSL